MSDERPSDVSAAVSAAIQAFDDALARLTHVANELRTPLLFDVGRLPKPGPALRLVATEARPVVGGPTPEELVLRLRADGPEWIAHADGRTLRAAKYALSVPDPLPELVYNRAFVGQVLHRLRERPKARLIAALVFSVYPVSNFVRAAADALDPGVELPAWWKTVGQPLPPEPDLARVLGVRARAGELGVENEPTLPRGARAGRWGVEIVKAASPRNLDDVRHLLAFADGGAARPGAPLSDAAKEALRASVRLAEAGRGRQDEVADLLRQRIGSPFGAAAEAQWGDLRDLLPKVRAWLAHELLEVVFEHITPSQEVAYQTRPRKEYWQQRSGSVRAIWVAVSPALEPQLKHPDVGRMQELMGDDLKFRVLRGGETQAVVWMHLSGPKGDVTALEGNANTSLRFRDGHVAPPVGRVIQYTADIVQGRFSTARAVAIGHRGAWTVKANEQLNRFGIRPDR